MILVLVNTLWISISDFTLEYLTFLGITLIGVAMLGISHFYRRYRPDPRLAAGVGATGFLIIFSAVAAIFSYLSTSLNLPLIDRVFAESDAVFGFYWPDWITAVNAVPTVGWILEMAYRSSAPQFLVIVLCLSMAGRFDHLSEFVDCYVFSLILVLVIAALFPSAGAFTHFQPEPSAYGSLRPFGGLVHMEHFFGLRDGSMRSIVLSEVQGLVTFPSFHTCLAIISAWALRGVRYVNVAAFVLNAIVIVATPSHGGHYLVDVMGGAVIAVLVISGRRFVLSARGRPDLVPAST